MIITCPECDTKYRYDERRFDGDPSKQVKCTSCGFTFEAANPVMAPAEVVAAAEPGDDELFEMDGGAPSGWNPGLGDVEAPTPIPTTVDSPPPEKSEQSEPLPPLPTDPRYSLAVIAGGQAGSVFQIHKPKIRIGRGSSMDIQLRDSEISRHHAVLEIRDPEVTLTDIDTTNGTWFNGSQIQTTKLNHQDEFTVGSTTLMLIITPVQDAR